MVMSSGAEDFYRTNAPSQNDLRMTSVPTSMTNVPGDHLEQLRLLALNKRAPHYPILQKATRSLLHSLSIALTAKNEAQICRGLQALSNVVATTTPGRFASAIISTSATTNTSTEPGSNVTGPNSAANNTELASGPTNLTASQGTSAAGSY